MAEIRPKIEKLFSGWRQRDTPRKNLAEVAVRESQQVYLIDRPDSEQSIIFAGNVAPPPGAGNEIAIEAMNEIIGGAFTSRVNMNLREDKGWAYGAFTLLWNARGQRPFIAYAPVQTDRTAESIAELRRELVEYLGSAPPTDDELAKVKANNTLSLPGRWETSAAVLRDISELVAYGLPDDYWNTYADRVRSLSLQELNAAADAVIKPDGLIWVVVGDRDRIEGQIRELELGPVTLLDADGRPL